MDIRTINKIELLEKENLEHKPLFDNAMPMYLIDTNYIISRASRECVRLLGLRPEEVQGKKCFDVWNLPICGTEECTLKRMLRGELISKYAIQKKIRNGKTLACNLRTDPRAFSRGGIAGLIAIMREVTEHADMNIRPDDCDRLANALLNSPYCLSIIIDPHGDILNLSRSMAGALKSNCADLIGKSIWDVIPSGFPNIRKNYIADMVKFRTPVHYEDQAGESWFDYVIYPITGPADEILKIAILCRDISIQKKTGQALKAANEKLIREQQALQQKNIALKEILAQIDDEKGIIKTTIQNNIEKTITPALRKLKGKSNPDQIALLEMLDRQLREICAPFISKLESKYGELAPREVEICNMIKDGMSSKEIAAVNSISVQTVCMHRKRIRTKLDITNQKINLASYLKSL
jgi:PAS domain S-box-containing protein